MNEYRLLEAKRVLVLAPHQDDETLGCGGTLVLLSRAGADVRVVFVSDGGKIHGEKSDDERADIISIRKKEAEDAADVLGITQTYFLGYPDGGLRWVTDKIEADVARIIEEFNPEVVLSPSPIDYHDDHIAVSHVATAIGRNMRGEGRLAFFQVYGTMRFNALVDITDVADVKSSAVLRYDCSLLGDPQLFGEAEMGINRYLSFHSQKRGYYEAFFIVPETAEMPAIIDWLTYGEKRPDPAEIFLSKLKAVDELLFESERSQERIAAMESETERLKAEAGSREKIVSGMKAEIDAKTDLLNVTALHLDESQRRIDMFEKSIFWKLAMKFYRVRDVLMPSGTIQRRFYDDLLYRFKSNVKH